MGLHDNMNLPDNARDDGDFANPSSKGYALSGKIMLSAIVILFFVVILMVCLHLYARWYLLRARRRQIRRVRNRRNHLVFYVDPANPTHVTTIPNRGLDSNVLKTLPVFTYSSKTHTNSIECAVCLSEFEENEKGRVLPKCKHSFHTECIDMWFHSHSTCPLCRSPVEPVLESLAREDPILYSGEIVEIGSGSGLCATCQPEEATTSGGKPVELVGVTIEVPGRNNGGFDDQFPASGSPASRGLRSPVGRMLSFKRILSREKRASCVAEVDIERGETRVSQN